MPFVEVSGGTRIHYRVTGPRTGEPLVLIMGLGWDMSGWEPLLPHVEDYRVLRVDNRGTGRSDTGESRYTIRRMAADVVAAMDAAGFDRAHVYGASLGSMIAQELAIQYPDRVRSLILGCPSPGVVSVPGAPGILRLLLTRKRYTAEDAFRMAAPYLFGVSVDEHPDRIEATLHRRMARTFNPVGYRRQLGAVLRWTSLGRLHRVKAPTLVIHGDRDRLIPIANGRLVARMVRGAQLRVLHGAGHIYATDRPNAHLRVLFDWLDHHASRGARSVRDNRQDEVRRPLRIVEQEVALG